MNNNHKNKQAFRSTRSHILTLVQLPGWAKEYRLLLCVTYVDYEKAYDNVKTNTKRRFLSRYTTNKSLLSLSIRVLVEKGIKQGDTISLKLFTLCLEQIIRDINWWGGVNINSMPLTHLHFTEDIVLITETTDQLQIVLTELVIKSSEVGLKIDCMEIKIMWSECPAIGQILIRDDKTKKWRNTSV